VYKKDHKIPTHKEHPTSYTLAVSCHIVFCNTWN